MIPENILSFLPKVHALIEGSGCKLDFVFKLPYYGWTDGGRKYQFEIELGKIKLYYRIIKLKKL